MYSYQCSSALIVSYVPVMLSSVWSAALFKSLQVLVLAAWPLILRVLRKMPSLGCAWFVCSSAAGEQTDPMHLILLSSSASVMAQALMTNRWKCTYELYFHMSVLLTFGLASPFLGFATGCSYVVQSTAYVLFVGRIRAQARDQADRAIEEGHGDRVDNDATASIEAVETDLEHQLHGIYDHVYGPMWLIVVTSFLFWSLFAYDMVGDVYGAEAGTTTVLVTIFVTPVLIFICVVLVLMGMAMMEAVAGKQRAEVTDNLKPEDLTLWAFDLSALRTAISGTAWKPQPSTSPHGIRGASNADGSADGPVRTAWSQVYPHSINSLFVARSSSQLSLSRGLERSSAASISRNDSHLRQAHVSEVEVASIKVPVVGENA
jgi:hypothetical protein